VLPHYTVIGFDYTSSHTEGYYYRSLRGSGRGDLKITQESVVIGANVTVVIQNVASRDFVRERVKLERRRRR
jgi:hypothetical protein